MSEYLNDQGQAIGLPLPEWQGCQHPGKTVMQGRLCRLEPIDAERHGSDLFTAFSKDPDGRNWTYLPYGPFLSAAELGDWINTTCLGEDPCFFTVIDLANGKAVGVASFLRIEPAIGVIEVGHIHFSPLMQGQAISTEALYLMMRRVFGELGYRRFEWKCDALNRPSCAAAARLGFLFEGIFRQATIYKRRNRDTAWFAMLDREWPVARAAFESWLDADNFDADGTQKQSLAGIMQPGLAALR